MSESKTQVREKDIIFLAYANSAKNPLSYLKKEYQETHNLLNQTLSDTIEVHSKLGVTRDYIIDFLINYREKILVFQFSGHADQDTLILEDDATNPKGIIQTFS